MNSTKTQTTLGVIVGNRGFFPDHLCEAGRKKILEVLAAENIKAVVLEPNDTKFGSVESYDDAKKCAALFQQHRDGIDGILVTLPNFGDERGVANTIRLSGLTVPVMVHAFPDNATAMTIKDRRDSFCGKISVCNNLNQYGIPFTLPDLHTQDPDQKSFRDDLRWFTAVCRVVKGMRRVRIGAVGARPAAFNTVRYSEKLLEAAGVSVETIDLSEIFGRALKLANGDAKVNDKLQAIDTYVATGATPKEALVKMAKLGVVLDEWIAANDLAATAIQCWTSMEEFYGVAPCMLMSMLGDKLIPSACEVDIPGLLGMYALQLASGEPSAIADWNNNYGDDPDKCVLFHCSNFPKKMLKEGTMDYQNIIAGTVGKDNTHGTMVGRIKAGPFTFARLTTDDENGIIRAYVGEGGFTEDPLQTFGGYGVAHIPDLQGLLAHLCFNAFEHHVAVSHCQAARALAEAMETYLGYEVYHHNEE